MSESGTGKASKASVNEEKTHSSRKTISNKEEHFMNALNSDRIDDDEVKEANHLSGAIKPMHTRIESSSPNEGPGGGPEKVSSGIHYI